MDALNDHHRREKGKNRDEAVNDFGARVPKTICATRTSLAK